MRSNLNKLINNSSDLVKSTYIRCGYSQKKTAEVLGVCHTSMVKLAKVLNLADLKPANTAERLNRRATRLAKVGRLEFIDLFMKSEGQIEVMAKDLKVHPASIYTKAANLGIKLKALRTLKAQEQAQKQVQEQIQEQIQEQVQEQFQEQFATLLIDDPERNQQEEQVQEQVQESTTLSAIREELSRIEGHAKNLAKDEGGDVAHMVEVMQKAKIIQWSLKLLSGLFAELVSEQNKLAEKSFAMLDEAVYQNIAALPEPMRTLVMEDASVRDKYTSTLLKQHGMPI